MKKRILSLLLTLPLLISLSSCFEKELTEEEHQKLIAEIGAMNRERHEKRQRFLDSPLHAEGYAYLEEVVRELVPDGDCILAIDPGGYVDAADEELSATLDTDEARLAFFARADVHIFVNFWDFGIDDRELGEALLDRQISGVVFVDESHDTEMILDAVAGTIDFYVRPGV